MRVTNWTNPTPPRPDQIDLMQPLDLSHPQARGLIWSWLGVGFGRGSNKVIDLSPRRNHGTLTRMDPATDWVFDRQVGWGLDFDGSDDYTEVPFTIGLPFTISCWLRLPGAGACYALSLSESAYTTRQFYIGTGAVDPSRWTFALRHNTTFTDNEATSAAGAVAAGVWVQLTGVAVATTLRQLYVNGVLAGTNTTSMGTPVVDRMWIGGLGDSTPSYSAVRIANVMVYNRVLAASEVFNVWHPGRRWGMLRTLTGRTTVFVPAAPPAATVNPWFFQNMILRGRGRG
jgi:hypothetical protein